MQSIWRATHLRARLGRRPNGLLTSSGCSNGKRSRRCGTHHQDYRPRSPAGLPDLFLLHVGVAGRMTDLAVVHVVCEGTMGPLDGETSELVPHAPGDPRGRCYCHRFVAVQTTLFGVVVCAAIQRGGLLDRKRSGWSATHLWHRRCRLARTLRGPRQVWLVQRPR